jgi:methionyl-tRNA formyltransferase
MLLVESYPIPEGMNAGQLHNTLSELAGPMVVAALKGLQDKTLTGKKQPDTGVEYARKITKDDCRIDWNRPAESIYYQILGLSPTPGTYFIHNGETIKIFNASLETKPTNIPPGTIVNDTLGIACNPGTLYPSILQRPNKKRMPLDEFLNGFSIPANTALA